MKMKYIPRLDLIKLDGRLVYLKRCTIAHFFIKYKGFGISESILMLLDKDKDILIQYMGYSLHYYLVPVSMYLAGDAIPFDNDGDLQYIVPVSRMKELKLAKR